MILQPDSLYHELQRMLTPRYGDSEGRAVALWVLAEAFGFSRTEAYAGKGRDFPEDAHTRFVNIYKRLEQGMPVQYAVGHTTFGGRRFGVEPGVLIPRPETEELVQWAVCEMRQMPATSPRVLDGGTGSGCIAISVALEVPEAQVTACDVSTEALRVAERNADALGAHVQFERWNLLALPAACGPFDVIISNPPYICRREAADMLDHVLRYEPHTALFVPDDAPLLFYHASAQQSAAGLLAHGGWLMVEVNRAYARQVAAAFSTAGLREVQVRCDAFGCERMVAARR